MNFIHESNTMIFKFKLGMHETKTFRSHIIFVAK